MGIFNVAAEKEKEGENIIICCCKSIVYYSNIEKAIMLFPPSCVYAE